MPTVAMIDVQFDPTDSSRGYKLVTTGGIVPFGSAPPLRSPELDLVFADWQKRGVAPAQCLRITEWGAHPKGYVVDNLGGVTPVGGAPQHAPDKGYWPKGFQRPAPVV